VPKQPTALSRFVDAANEPDPAVRVRTLAEVWAPDATLTIDGDVVVRGADELEAFLVRWQEDPRAHLWLLHDERDGPHEWGEWKVEGLEVRRDVYAVRARLDDDGRLTAMRATQAPDRLRPPLRERLGQLGLPGLAAALTTLGGALYFALYLPLSLFYRDLGVSPWEIGYGPQVLVPQSLTLIVLFGVFVGLWALGRRPAFAALNLDDAGRRLSRAGDRRTARVARGALWAVTGPAAAGAALALTAVTDNRLTGVASALLMLLKGGAASALVLLAGFLLLWPVTVVLRRRLPALDAQMRALEQRQARAGTRLNRLSWVLAVILLYGALLLVALPIWALSDAAAIRRGGEVGGRLTPWRADPVTLRWTGTARVALTNECRHLRLLGVGNGQLVLFDTKLDKLFRVPVADASASVDRDCA
jgi:hypothetical protein